MIYVVLNLPHNICYKRENVILIGVIPGPEEPKHDINSFLPMVNELLDLWMAFKWISLMQAKRFGVLLCVQHVTFQQVERCADFWVIVQRMVAHTV